MMLGIEVATLYGKTKIACIGDSITFGMGLSNRKVSAYPVQLQKMLNQKAKGKYEVKNFGNSGRGIYLDSMRGNEMRGFYHMKEHKAALKWNPDIVICNLGINDNEEYLKEYTGERKRGQFVEDYVFLLNEYKKINPNVEFYIWNKLAPLAEGQRHYRSHAPFLMQSDLDRVAEIVGASTIDMQEPLRERMEKIFKQDKLHPDSEGAKIIAKVTCDLLFAKKKELVALPSNLSEAGHETWLCAGQSNMQKGWGEFNTTSEQKSKIEAEMKRLEKCDIRFWDFNDGSWTKLTPSNALKKCAVGVSFAIRRAEATSKTILILYTAAGGAPTESFLSEPVMCALDLDGKPLYPHLAAITTNRHQLDSNSDFPCSWVAKEYLKRRANKESSYWWPVSKIYDGGLKQIAHLDVDGILWYQGESNASTGGNPDLPTNFDYQKETLYGLVHQLRSTFTKAKPIPILMVGLPKMNRPWESYRQAQKEVCDATGAIYIDTFAHGLGEENDVHPQDKIPFATLAAEAASKVLDSN